MSKDSIKHFTLGLRVLAKKVAVLLRYCGLFAVGSYMLSSILLGIAVLAFDPGELHAQDGISLGVHLYVWPGVAAWVYLISRWCFRRVVELGREQELERSRENWGENTTKMW